MKAFQWQLVTTADTMLMMNAYSLLIYQLAHESIIEASDRP